jgi:hypothetical protein
MGSLGRSETKETEILFLHAGKRMTGSINGSWVARIYAGIDIYTDMALFLTTQILHVAGTPLQPDSQN